jgi:hypothetical protein
MDPISFGIELELGALLLAAVGAVATWLHNRHHKAAQRQRERHHEELKALEERFHEQQLQALQHEDRDVRALASAERAGRARRGQGRKSAA